MHDSDYFGQPETTVQFDFNPWSKKLRTNPNDPWTKATQRNCLRCNRAFVAKGKYLRFCPSCRSLNATTYNCAETFKMVDGISHRLKDDLADDFQTRNPREKNESRTDINPSAHPNPGDGG